MCPRFKDPVATALGSDFLDPRCKQLTTLLKGPVDHFTPKMTNGYMGLLDPRGPIRGNHNGKVTMGNQRFS